MRDAAFLRAAEIREMVAAHPDKFELAFLPEDAKRIAAKKKIFVYQSIENSGILGNDVTLLRSFYKLGVRMAGPIHFLNNQLGDSATDKTQMGRAVAAGQGIREGGQRSWASCWTPAIPPTMFSTR